MSIVSAAGSFQSQITALQLEETHICQALLKADQELRSFTKIYAAQPNRTSADQDRFQQLMITCEAIQMHLIKHREKLQACLANRPMLDDDTAAADKFHPMTDLRFESLYITSPSEPTKSETTTSAPTFTATQQSHSLTLAAAKAATLAHVLSPEQQKPRLCLADPKEPRHWTLDSTAVNMQNPQKPQKPRLSLTTLSSTSSPSPHLTLTPTTETPPGHKRPKLSLATSSSSNLSSGRLSLTPVPSTAAAPPLAGQGLSLLSSSSPPTSSTSSAKQELPSLSLANSSSSSLSSGRLSLTPDRSTAAAPTLAGQRLSLLSSSSSPTPPASLAKQEQPKLSLATSSSSNLSSGRLSLTPVPSTAAAPPLAGQGLSLLSSSSPPTSSTSSAKQELPSLSLANSSSSNSFPHVRQFSSTYSPHTHSQHMW